MPLVKDILNQKVKTFSDQSSSLFEGFPINIKENAEKWADAIDLYANSILSSVIPTSTTGSIAKKALLDILNGVSEPVEEVIQSLPFTIYYRCPEIKMILFIDHLRKIGYKSTPNLDKSNNFKILRGIQKTYNQARPVFALSEEDIFYNQARFNQVYEVEINERKHFTLLPDGVTVDSSNLARKYKDIPVNQEGIIIPLQVDGIIGDDTIRYKPAPPQFFIYEANSDEKWNRTYSKIPFFLQPSTAGEIWIDEPVKNSNGDYITRQQKVSSSYFKKKYIDTKLSKDYSKFIIDKTQAETDGGLFENRKDSVIGFTQAFEANHSTCDRIWINNSIKTITEYDVFLKSKKKEFKAKLPVEKNVLTALENGINAYAISLAVGMNPTFTAAASVIPLSFQSVIAKGKSGGSNKDCVDLMINLIDTYFKSGIATNNSSGSTISWQ